LKTEDLSIKYHDSDQWAINDISFIAHPGEITLITGASGSGKSTLARTLMTLIPKFYSADVKGNIIINDKKIEAYTRSELMKLYGYVPQYPADFITTLSVEEEIALVLENLGESPDNINSKIEEIFLTLKIDHLRNKVQTELSSGELQRIAIAVALAPDVPILILDEPMARIDLKSEVMLVNLLKKLANQGKMILAFEHRLDYLLSASHKVIILENGTIKAEGRPNQIVNELSEVDMPEISNLKIKNVQQFPLSLLEAQNQILKFLS
jgi:energy-coupling factor transporter ATP-binding protein EcfA2